MTAEEIVRKLTKAQREVVLSLPGDGHFGPASSFGTAKYMWWGILAGRETRLIEHQHLTDNSWRLNNRGLEVRRLLENTHDRS